MAQSRAAGKDVAAKLACYAHATITGSHVGPVCLAAADARLAAALAKAAARGGCANPRNDGAIAAAVDDCVAALTPLLTTRPCDVAKSKAAAADAAAILRCYQRAALAGGAVDPVCIAAPEAKLATRLAQIAARGCGAASDTGIAPAVEACVAGIDAETPVTTTTTSSVTTTTSIPGGTTTTTVPGAILSGCASGGYSTDVTIAGTGFTVIADSGSTTLGVASSLCAQCTGLSPRYTQGATGTNTGLTASTTYGDGSTWAGPVISDLVSAAGAASLRMAFVAIDSQTGFFQPGGCNFTPVANTYQGILGLGGAALAEAGTDSYVDKLSTSLTHDLFAVQLCGVGGHIWWGGYDPTALIGAPTYTPLIAASPYYAVVLSDLRVGGSSLGFGAATFGDTLVDTGTTAILLPTAVFNALAASVGALPAFQQNFGGAAWFSGSTCNVPNTHLTKAQLDQALPPLTLVFPAVGGGSFSVQLPATDSYLLQQDDSLGNAYYCPGIEAGALTIVGANAMHTLITVFDHEHGAIGFARQQGCPALAGERSLAARATAPAPLPKPPYRHRPIAR